MRQHNGGLTHTVSNTLYKYNNNYYNVRMVGTVQAQYRIQIHQPAHTCWPRACCEDFLTPAHGT